MVYCYSSHRGYNGSWSKPFGTIWYIWTLSAIQLFNSACFVT